MKGVIKRPATNARSVVLKKSAKARESKRKFSLGVIKDACFHRAATSAKHLEQLALYLRSGDTKLVRPFPSGITARRQHAVAKGGLIPAVVSALEATNERARAAAAEVLHLLCTNCPKNRQEIGRAGAIDSLAKLLTAGIANGASQAAIRASEEAGEALWILAFAGDKRSGRNHTEAGIQSEKVVNSLVKTVLQGRSCKAKMWGAAALGNIMAEYDAVPSKSSEAVRAKILKQKDFLRELVRLASLGPVDNTVSKQCWPGEAQTHHRHSKHIIPWAALHALNNGSLFVSSHKAMRRAGVVPVATRHLTSPDWLESMKSELVLTNLGESVRQA